MALFVGGFAVSLLGFISWRWYLRGIFPRKPHPVVGYGTGAMFIGGACAVSLAIGLAVARGIVYLGFQIIGAFQ